LAIKMTLYRTGANSPLGTALLEAARRGKEVTAVIELRARFDEAENIALASALQQAGATVAYGIVGFKAHAKMLLVVRREGKHVRTYTHLGTGNYNNKTARTYTDFGLMTSNEEIAQDAHAVFSQLTGLGRSVELKRLIQTPFGLHDRLLELIANEEKEARAGRKAQIIFKVNSLNEPGIIQALYSASQAGVKVDLIVRGVCTLRPGLKGVSDNIRVRSIVGRFLEHHRIFSFHAAGQELTFLSSADLMPRNLFRRVEVVFPVEGKKNRERVMREGLECYLTDNTQSWEMGSDGSYKRCTPGKAPERSAQSELLASLANIGP
jgi:polyphosphate kinase